jgi:2'-5' RNA ligase
VRLFVALTLPDTIRRSIAAAVQPLQRTAPEIRWIGPDALHITLKFFGEVPDQHVQSVRDGLLAVVPEASAFDLELGGIGGFPNLRRPRVVWLGVRAGAGLSQLHEALEHELARRGFPRETRPYAPHLTIGRVSREYTGLQLPHVERAALNIAYDAKVEVRSLELMQSRLSPQGARYDTLTSVPLPESAGEA